MSFGEPSFSCDNKNLNETEKTICKRKNLSNNDKLLSRLYKSAKKKNKSEIVRAQRKWIKTRNDCGDNSSCIKYAYRKRLYELADILELFDSENVKDPALYTILDWIETSYYEDEPKCYEFKDINLDNINEIACIPPCGGPACTDLFFASKSNYFKYIPELGMGTYDTLRIAKEEEIPDHIKSKYPNLDGNNLNNWKVLFHQYRDDISFLCLLSGKYKEC